MIGLDSNILLRAIANDDKMQSPLARDFLSTLSSSNPAYINSVVLDARRFPAQGARSAGMPPRVLLH